MQVMPVFQIPPQVTPTISVNAMRCYSKLWEPKLLSSVAQYLGLSFLRAATANKQWFAVAVTVRHAWLEHSLAQYCECGKVNGGTVEPCRWGCSCTRGNNKC